MQHFVFSFEPTRLRPEARPMNCEKRKTVHIPILSDFISIFSYFEILHPQIHDTTFFSSCQPLFEKFFLLYRYHSNYYNMKQHTPAAASGGTQVSAAHKERH
jgi:hypothetical protein